MVKIALALFRKRHLQGYWVGDWPILWHFWHFVAHVELHLWFVLEKRWSLGNSGGQQDYWLVCTCHKARSQLTLQSFIGMLSNLEDKTTDFVVGAYGINLVRYPYTSWLPPLTKADAHIFIKQQTEEHISWDLLINPFAVDLWITIVLMALLFAIVLFSINNLFYSDSVINLMRHQHLAYSLQVQFIARSLVKY